MHVWYSLNRLYLSFKLDGWNFKVIYLNLPIVEKYFYYLIYYFFNIKRLKYSVYRAIEFICL